MQSIKLQHVSKSFDDTRAVQQLDLEIPQGSMCGFLGPNGAGKSTTIRMIMSIIHPDSGTIDVLGTTAIEAKDRIGYLPEERGVYRKMKVCKFIEYIANLKGMHGPSLRKKINEWLERIELPSVRQKKCEELSKGMQQKVQFLAAIIHEPELIILDEPFTGLDPVNAPEVKVCVNRGCHGRLSDCQGDYRYQVPALNNANGWRCCTCTTLVPRQINLDIISILLEDPVSMALIYGLQGTNQVVTISDRC